MVASLLLMGLVFGGVVHAQTVRDVPPNHWAYQAVVDLVSKGYLSVEDGLFRGDQPADRFTLATVVARLLNEIQAGSVTLQSREDVDTLRKVVTEFTEELVMANVKIEDVEVRLEAALKGQLATDEKVSQVIAGLSALERRAELIEESLIEQSRRMELRLDEHEVESQVTHAQLAREAEQLRQGLAELQRTVESLFAELGSETARRVDSLESTLMQQLANQGIELGDLEGQFSQAANALERDIQQLRALLEEDMANLASLRAESAAAQEDLAALTADVEGALREIRSELNAHAEALAAQQLALMDQKASLDRQGEALARADSELLSELQALRARVDSLAALDGRLQGMQGQIDGIERQVLAMQSQIGLSDEQLRALSDRLMQELESQFQHSFLLAGSVNEDLKSLREEFQSYRQKTERDLSSAGQAQLFGIIGAVLGLIGLFN